MTNSVQQQFLRSVSLHQQGKNKEALDICEHLLITQGSDENIYTLTGVILIQLGRYLDALEMLNQAISINPNNLDAHYNIGVILQSMHRINECIASYQQVLKLQPKHCDALNNLGAVLFSIHEYEEALVVYDRLTEVNSNYAQAYNNKGLILGALNSPEEAVVCFERALSLVPGYEYLLDTLIHYRMKICDWSNYEKNLNQMLTEVAQGAKVSTGFSILSVAPQAKIHRIVSEVLCADKYAEKSGSVSLVKKTISNKIRIGYFSADFHNHATTCLMAELFERHDRDRFELFAFSFGPDLQDQMRHRVTSAFDHFFDVRFKSDEEIAKLSRVWSIDIAVDLKGLTQDHRLGIFSYRAAPIQVNYIGYPGTVAAPYMDYIIADHTLIPKESRQYYSEKVVYLPGSYQVNDRQRKIADRIFTRAELGLPEQGFVFCCFNNNYKITPDVFDSWVRILLAVPGSVLWLFEDNPTAAANLRKEAQQRGLDPNRLVFAKKMELSEHLARHRLADLFLDTLPYNAHTTASDALWVGLPVLTRMGESFASRVAGSLLNAIGLPELITDSPQAYEPLAIQLATHPDQLNAIKAKLEQNRLTTPLFDTEKYTKHLETAYQSMCDRYQADLPPDHIEIEA